MAGRSRLSGLPDELVAEILARLPLRDVARARAVCRQWRALTMDHHFLRATASRAAAGFFLNDRYGIRTDYSQLPSALDRSATAGDEGCPAPDLSFVPGAALATDPPRGGIANIHVSSSCHGLLMLVCWPCRRPASNYYICNPLTRELAPIPWPERLLHYPSLAFEPSVSRHYRLVSLGHMYAIHVYSSETRSWRTAVPSERAVDLFVGLRSLRGVFWNGSMVWTVAHSLIRFVLEGEHLTTISMPPKMKEGWICAYVGESAGHLQMIGYTKQEKLTACFDILEMQGDQSEWSHLYRADLGQVKELHPEIEMPTSGTWGHQNKIIDYLALSPVCVIRGTGEAGQHGMLIFSIPGKIMAYNMLDRTISEIAEVQSSASEVRPQNHLEPPWYNFFAYYPSLFTL